MLPLIKKNELNTSASTHISLILLKEMIYICLTKIRLMGKDYLGEFEELILTIVGILEDKAYGNAVVEEIWNQLARKVNLNTVHITLYRLEDRGLLKSHYGGATSNRGGRRKRLFKITNAGINLLKVQQEQKQKLWNLLPSLRMIYS